MGQAILNGWLRSGFDKSEIKIVDPYAKNITEVEVFDSLTEIGGFQPDYILLAVKPQTLPDVMAELQKFSKAIFISIAAGKSLSFFEKHLDSATIIRTMPNLPAAIGKGVTALISNKNLPDSQKSSINKMFEACGETIWLDDESQVDAVTAISGSGPAYCFLFMDALAKSGEELGLSAEMARKLAIQTLAGSAEMAWQSAENLVTLKENVTSKAGTTEAALQVFEDKNALRELVSAATSAAHKRAGELSE
ncbi:MAG: pyrroline-5-carboxylate reductase [Alphaproteobacteria bacterium CG11_big_fil_rev_8_21_14_0_20_44_7]|nr:MAG: pyrroline-5-carboxylate reductase [Alphaproteobacteria bacterium CG11_big_fil_rev_8_21_14_0_20_44_7]